MATQGLLKTAISVASNEVKDNFTKGIKEGLSEYIAKDLLDINNKGNDEQRKKDIKLASDLSASVSIDIFVGGAYSIVKGSKNVVKADEKLKESNVNSNAIAKSNAELERKEHSLNNKNGSDGVGVAGNGIKATSENPLNKANDAQKVEKVTKVADNKDIDKILENADKGRTTSIKKTKQFEKNGGIRQAEKDYKDLTSKTIKEHVKSDGSTVTIGKLKDGSTINYRSVSTDGRATLEIQRTDGTTIKIRYND